MKTHPSDRDSMAGSIDREYSYGREPYRCAEAVAGGISGEGEDDIGISL